MQIYDPSGEFNVLVISHPGQPDLEFGIKNLNCPKTVTPTEIFELTNGYFEALHIERQKRIYDVYAKIHSSMKRVYGFIRSTNILKELCTELYKEILYDEICGWTKKAEIAINLPATVKDRYDQTDLSERRPNDTTYRDRTYITSEYIDLVHMIIAVRAMIPIWGEYLAKIKASFQVPTHSEFSCLELLGDSSIVKLEPYDRLYRLVNAHISTTANDQDLNSAAFAGMGSDLIGQWAMAHALVRKLCVVDLTSGHKNFNVMSVLFRTLVGTSSHMSRRFMNGNRLLNRPEPKNDDMDANKSITDSTQVRESMPVADVVAIDYFARESWGIYEHIFRGEIAEKYGQPDHQLWEAVMSYHDTIAEKEFSPDEPILDLMRWTLAPVHSPQDYEEVEHRTQMSMMLTTVCILLHIGKPDLAMLVTSEPEMDEHGNRLGGVMNRPRVTKEAQEEFAQTHPYYHIKGSRTQEHSNIAHTGVDDLCRKIYANGWKNLCPDLVKSGVPERYRFNHDRHDDHVPIRAAVVKNDASSLLIFIDDVQNMLLREIREDRAAA